MAEEGGTVLLKDLAEDVDLDYTPRAELKTNRNSVIGFSSLQTRARVNKMYSLQLITLLVWAFLTGLIYQFIVSLSDTQETNEVGPVYYIGQALAVWLVASFIEVISPVGLMILDPFLMITYSAFTNFNGGNGNGNGNGNGKMTPFRRIGIFIVVVIFSLVGFIVGAFSVSAITNETHMPNRFNNVFSDNNELEDQDVVIFIVELIASFFVFWGIYSDRYDDSQIYGFKRGPAMLGAFYLAFGLHGEPSVFIWRVLASSITETAFDNSWAYYVGPIVGWLLITILYIGVLSDQAAKKKPKSV